MERNIDTNLIRPLTDAELDTVSGGVEKEKNAFVEGFDGLFTRLFGNDGHGKGPIHHLLDSGAHYEE